MPYKHSALQAEISEVSMISNKATAIQVLSGSSKLAFSKQDKWDNQAYL